MTTSSPRRACTSWLIPATAVVVLLTSAAPVLAQPAPPAPCGGPGCTLSIRTSGLSVELVRGDEPGEVVADAFFFLPLDVSGAVPESSAAHHYARTYERSHWLSTAAAVTAGFLLYVVVSPDGLASEDVRTGAAVGGVALGGIAAVLSRRAFHARSGAIEAYNETLCPSTR